jgi:hypothetical protein
LKINFCDEICQRNQGGPCSEENTVDIALLRDARQSSSPTEWLKDNGTAQVLNLEDTNESYTDKLRV